MDMYINVRTWRNKHDTVTFHFSFLLCKIFSLVCIRCIKGSGIFDSHVKITTRNRMQFKSIHRYQRNEHQQNIASYIDLHLYIETILVNCLQDSIRIQLLILLFGILVMKMDDKVLGFDISMNNSVEMDTLERRNHLLWFLENNDQNKNNNDE